MSVTAFLKSLQAQGVRVWVRGDRLCIDAPTGVLTPELKSDLATVKAELLAYLGSNATFLECIVESPYVGFFRSPVVPKPDPVRAQEAHLEAERWRRERAAWLRDVLGVAETEER